MFQLKERKALVTGAGSGIGEAIAHTLAIPGATVYIADRDTAQVTRVATDVNQQGGNAVAVEMDVTREEDCQRAAEEVAHEGPLDILVKNAKVGHVGTIDQTTGDDLDRMYAVNVRGVFNTTKA